MRQQKRRIPWFGIIIAAAVVILLFGGTFVRLLTDWYWFKHDVRMPQVFETLIKTRLWMFAVGFIIATLFTQLNILPALKATMILGSGTRDDFEAALLRMLGWVQRSANRLAWAISIVVGLFFGATAASGAEGFLMYKNHMPFGKADPVFGHDIGFYMFQLPFIEFIVGFLLWLFIFVGIGTALVYYSNRALGYLSTAPMDIPQSRAHILSLIGLFWIIIAVKFYLGRYGILFGQHDQFFGASNSDLIIRLPSMMIMIACSLLMAIISFANIRWHKAYVPVGVGTIGFIVIAILSFGIVAGLYEQVVVTPNQYTKEEQNIQRGIEATRSAWGLDKIAVKTLPYESEPTDDEMISADSTFKNMRIWDRHVLIENFNNLQALRLYYHFRDSGNDLWDDNALDVDRYTVNGEQRVVIIGARELDSSRLTRESQTWQNLRLRYTHGYGLAMSLVNTATSEGSPYFIGKNIPPELPPEIKLEQPRIYYGEIDNGYVLVNSKLPEFDYPEGDAGEAAYKSYEGQNGIPVGMHYFMRFLFAIRFGDANIMLSADVTKETKLLFNRTIMNRVRMTYPFLVIDPDPYIAVVDGKLVWILDGYTRSENYPYSSYYGDNYIPNTNYARNSVKIVVSAYDGSLTAYIIDNDDPLIKVYQKIYPDMFASSDKMSDSLRKHLRYPKRYFMMQAAMYRYFHITDPKIFYQKEDAWELPKETLEIGNSRQMKPYYVQMRLPDKPIDEFQLIIPFTPLNRPNMIGWMSAYCDPEDYGKMIVYRYPESKPVPGPEIVYANFQQNPEISPQMSLWNSAKGGTDAKFGAFIVAPVGKSVIYVQPVYLRASNNAGKSVPQLRAVMLGVGERTTIGVTFEDAMRKLFPNRKMPASIVSNAQTATDKVKPQKAPQTSDNNVLIKSAVTTYDAMITAQKNGDWAKYGELQKKLGNLINELNKTSGQ